MLDEICVVCKSKLFYNNYKEWHAVCKNCGYEKANLQCTIGLFLTQETVNERSREIGLRKLRQKNFKKILMSLKLLKPTGGHLLDVGCAHGWFLEMAKNDFDVMGIEPDKNMVEKAAQIGSPVRFGFFPEALRKDERFDIIIFNDVFEHIPDITTALKSCYQHLSREGALILNLPSSKGIFYVLSKLLCRLGMDSFFDRLWQKELCSPHLSYFSPSNLEIFLKNNKFLIKRRGYLATISFKGLYKRIITVRKFGILRSAVIYLALIVTLPLLKIFPKDIFFVIALRQE